MSKLKFEPRAGVYSAVREALDFLIQNTDPSSELASLIMAREHIIDAFEFAKEKEGLH